MSYEEFIQNILDTRGRFYCGDEYHERHHIIPKCMDGTNDDDNLIDLSAREHFEAHRLLALENPDNEKLVYAWWYMSVCDNNGLRKYSISADEYEQSRKCFVDKISGKNNIWYDIHRFGEDNPMYGKTHSQETRDKISNKMKSLYQNPENSPMYGKHLSQETRCKISDRLKDIYQDCEFHPRRGKHHTKETKDKMRKLKMGKYDGANNPRCRKLIRLSDLKIYNYLNEAVEDNNVCKDTMRKYCKIHKDFMYYDEYIITQQNN